MKDNFGNTKPVQIEENEWWFNGRIIVRQKDDRLPTWISFKDSKNSYETEIHSSKADAVSFALKNPFLTPDNFPSDYIGGFNQNEDNIEASKTISVSFDKTVLKDLLILEMVNYMKVNWEDNQVIDLFLDSDFNFVASDKTKAEKVKELISQHKSALKNNLINHQ